MDYTTLVMIGGLAVLGAFGFYALKLLANFRSGMLEKGWKQIAIGSILLIFSQLLLIISQFDVVGLTTPLYLVGSACRILAMIFLILGLREHYLVWRIDKTRQVPLEK